MSEVYRRFPRVSSNHSVLVTKLDGELEEFALAKTMAVGGCCVLSPEPLGVQSPVELLIAIDRENVIKVLGRVVYEKVVDDGFTEAGIEFVHLNDDAARLIQRLFEAPHAQPHAPLA